ncbi:hypothetical protein Tco_0645819 [Tanacetum coccineum]
MQGVSKTDFENYVKANDAVLRNIQNQGQGLQNQMTNLMKMLSKFVNSNTASTSSSCSLPSNTITNPKKDLKGITTRSGVVYQGPTIPTSSSPKEMKRRTEVTKDMRFPTNNEITEDIQPSVVPVENKIRFLSQLVRRCLTRNRRFLILQGEMIKSAVKTLTNKLRNSTKSLKI